MASNVVKFRKKTPKRPRRSPLQFVRSQIFFPALLVGVFVGSIIVSKFDGTGIIGSPVTSLPNSEITSIYDGDTFRIGRERIRILGMDAPELGERAKCPEEQQKALEARDYLRRVLWYREIKIQRSHKDVYGRTLAKVYVDGYNIADEMISMGLAVRYSPSTHGKWCSLMVH